MDGVSVRIKRETWRDVKVIAAKEEKEIGVLATELIRKGMKSLGNNGGS